MKREEFEKRMELFKKLEAPYSYFETQTDIPEFDKSVNMRFDIKILESPVFVSFCKIRFENIYFKLYVNDVKFSEYLEPTETLFITDVYVKPKIKNDTSEEIVKAWRAFEEKNRDKADFDLFYECNY